MTDKFTETELPRGSMLVIGRSLDGGELACVIPIDDEERTAKIVKGLYQVLLFNDGIRNIKQASEKS